MNPRVERLRDSLEDPLLLTNATNIQYLSGFHSSNGALLVEPDGRLRLFTDFRYLAAAREVAGAEAVETSRSLIADLARLLSGRIGFEADVLPYALYETLRDGGLDLVPVSGLVERMRAVKDADELATIRRAAEVTDRAYARMAEERFVGSTERALAWRMEQLFREEGADELAFDIIVASGPNGSRPHADSGERTVETGQTVVVDAGCRIGAYNSDCTRTFATGPLPERLREAYAVCLEAQLAGLEAVRAGERGKDVDALVREQIDRTEFHGMFGHGLGHGVGMLVHEQPRLAPTAPDDEVLRPGNVVTVEPGIYLEGLGGIRIEDLVVVTDDGAEVLSSYTKDLVTVD